MKQTVFYKKTSATEIQKETFQHSLPARDLIEQRKAKIAKL